MSKATHSPLGQWRGRTGGQVYRVSRGEQIVSVYQPKVSNPRTAGQTAQRTRFNLMSRLNSLTPIELLRPFSATPATARSLFSKSLMRGITTSTAASTTTEVVYTALIAPTDVHFGEGATYQPANIDWNTNIAIRANAGTGIEVAIGADVFQNVVAVRVIDVCKRPRLDGDYVQIQYKDATVDAPSVEFEGADMYHRIYVQFIVANDREGAMRGSHVEADGTTTPENLYAKASAAINDYSKIGSSIYVQTINVPAS